MKVLGKMNTKKAFLVVFLLSLGVLPQIQAMEEKENQFYSQEEGTSQGTGECQILL